ncbi:large conductance mechanosensitive channel protein MscL [Niallia taxi]|uniref:Large-conductance mechanosensitive channel n=1 Tax=Niallia taxi TaxID=2499688 RepID=A0A437K6P6_9BACI|nr:large conductance mechanosensitive channel protein MscL [Niallia taxi]MCM3217384.1 large conductance mechanosensitive channel protein MscL [Niallia taxi]MDK8641421.1 large conductance mechanosensitive channel protein MscL [Niallia taxi]MED4039441.1 large conductance mechanosensitive channel protein MscL [Niallia taxi]MED4055745.1 large conductance mechanosensitive channel protein MscL [Niallia taxi]MED4121407.1 large conductance mechanosensitive channel protein MscL [Niallia taxi]
MWKEFKAFAVKGNVIDLAIGVIIGGAFSKIVSSLVNDIIMPIVGVLLGGVNLTSLQLTYGKATVLYGQFIQTILDFFIVAFSIFMVIKLITKFKRKKEEEIVEEKAPSIDAKEELLMEIRDLLKKDRVRQEEN